MQTLSLRMRLLRSKPYVETDPARVTRRKSRQVVAFLSIYSHIVQFNEVNASFRSLLSVGHNSWLSTQEENVLIWSV